MDRKHFVLNLGGREMLKFSPYKNRLDNNLLPFFNISYFKYRANEIKSDLMLKYILQYKVFKV